ncbi:MAG TPA: alkaline phosphatase family protein, partial [Anaerohalosphaeraceae bacterium]|nr:alkaline phosphatase family protein [Anaerohalosphaeraceae bacterium]
MNEQKRVLIIGLDGFCWGLGEKFLKENWMPALGSFTTGGSFGTLQSVLPYETSPAWVSFQTGCFPPKTGI